MDLRKLIKVNEALMAASNGICMKPAEIIGAVIEQKMVEGVD